MRLYYLRRQRGPGAMDPETAVLQPAKVRSPVLVAPIWPKISVVPAAGPAGAVGSIPVPRRLFDRKLEVPQEVAEVMDPPRALPRMVPPPAQPMPVSGLPPPTGLAPPAVLRGGKMLRKKLKRVVKLRKLGKGSSRLGKSSGEKKTFLKLLKNYCTHRTPK